MKPIRFVLPICAALVLAAPLRAELPPAVYEEAWKNAPELLEIEVTRVALNSRSSNRMKTTSVFADAIVKRVERSAAKTKVGDKISVRYLTSQPLEDGWAGPASNQILSKGTRYKAYLKKAGAHFYIAGLGRSFHESS